MSKRAEFDKFGHCIISGEMLYEERVVDGVLKHLPKPNMTHATYLLADGSLMRVCISTEEKKKLKNTKKEYDFIIDKVKKGWEMEVKQLVNDTTKPDWDKEKADNYMEVHNKKSISSRVDDIPFRTLSNVEKEVNRVKLKLLKEARKEVKNGS